MVQQSEEQSLMTKYTVSSECTVSLLRLPSHRQPVVSRKVYGFPDIKAVRESGMIRFRKGDEECSWLVLHLEYWDVVRGEEGRGDLCGHVVQLVRTL